MSGLKHTKIGPMTTGNKFSGPMKAGLKYLVQIAESMSMRNTMEVVVSWYGDVLQVIEEEVCLK